jgi:hypothetical protein
MLELTKRLGLDLPNALTGHAELLPDFLQGVIGVHADAEHRMRSTRSSRGVRLASTRITTITVQ